MIVTDILEEKFYNAAKNILISNLRVNEPEYINHKIVFVYDLYSLLSTKLSNGYIKALYELDLWISKREIEIINFSEIDNQELKNKLLSLSECSTVVLVQSTDFRLDDFRIRLNLHNAWVWCLEHNHLQYIKDDEIENYADALEYKMPYYESIANYLKSLSDKANTMTFICHDWSKLEVSGGFEDMKQNTWNYEWKNRWATFPIWECFTEAKIFDNLNGELSIYAYPDDKLQVQIVEPFKIKIEKSFITYIDPNCPEEYKKLMEKISIWEDNEIMVRELWFGLNNWISKQKKLSDVNAFERVAWFHLSLGKKHQIFRKKLHKDVTQRYHIDIFPDIKEIYIDEVLVFEKGEYLI